MLGIVIDFFLLLRRLRLVGANCNSPIGEGELQFARTGRFFDFKRISVAIC